MQAEVTDGVKDLAAKQADETGSYFESSLAIRLLTLFMVLVLLWADWVLLVRAQPTNARMLLGLGVLFFSGIVGVAIAPRRRWLWFIAGGIAQLLLYRLLLLIVNTASVPLG